MFCDKCGSPLPKGVRYCSNCGKEFSENQINTGAQPVPNMGQPQAFTGYQGQAAYPPPVVQVQQQNISGGYNALLAKARSFANGIKIYDTISGIAWILIGALQILLVLGGADSTLLVIGVVNIIGAVRCISSAQNIQAGNSSVIDAFKVQIGTSVVFFFINLYIGAWLGYLLAAADFIVAIIVVNHQQYFDPKILNQ